MVPVERAVTAFGVLSPLLGALATQLAFLRGSVRKRGSGVGGLENPVCSEIAGLSRFSEIGAQAAYINVPKEGPYKPE